MNSSERKIYFIRHGRADFPLNERMCLGRTDLGLGPVGRMQAVLLKNEFENSGVELSAVFSSPLKRAFETATYLSDDYSVIPGFIEASAGEWDGLNFAEIMEKWPELYEARGTDRSIPIPGSEPEEDVRARFTEAFNLYSLLSFGDIAIVSHDTVMRLYLGIDPDIRIPNGAYILNGEIHVPHPEMTPELAKELRDAAGMPDNIKAHCDAVAVKALELADGLELDNNLIECAALLHDLARLEHNHEALGAEYIKYLGYGELSEVIRQHSDLDDENLIDESAILYLADKYIRDTDTVSISERFSGSCSKCMTPDGKAVHDRRLSSALRVEKKYMELKGN